MPVTTLLGGLVARFAADSDLILSVPRGLWVGQVPEDMTLPFVALLHKGEVPDWTFEKDYQEVGNVDFIVYAKGLAAAEAIATQVKAAFDWCTLVITGALSVYVQRTNYQVDIEEVRAADAELVYTCTISYETRLRKTLA